MQKEQGLEEIRNVLILNTSSLSDVGLYGGKMGVSIFLAHYARYSNQDIYLDLVHSLIKEIFEDLDNSFSSLKSATIIQYTIKGRFMSR